MKAKLHQFWQAFRPVLIAWVTVALLLPTLLAVMPSGAAAHAISFSEICSAQNANLPDDHKKHSQDCPCCVLSGVAHMGLPPRDAVEIVDPPRREEAVFVAQAVFLAVTQSYVAHALARGPPEFLNI
ncbi:MAG: hypothetical protein M3O03_14205 [Pseudomonadota bacterium]|nr:hypothetical protein [Pseudomonadota bacterium]